MSDLVGSPEDRFSHNEAQLFSAVADDRVVNVTRKHLPYDLSFLSDDVGVSLSRTKRQLTI